MSVYKDYSPEQQQNLFDQFLISSWSYSKVASFSRNQKAFEMSYIYGIYGKSSATTKAGEAYHSALQHFFEQFKQGVQIDLVELESVAFAKIDSTPANLWRIQKTTPTIEEVVKKAYTTVSSLLKNFMSEVNTYTDEILEVIEVEVYCDQFLTINGVDMPLPCHAKIDLIIKTKDGKNVIIDHKSKAVYTDDAEMALSIGTQAITYVKSYEERSGINIDEVWFVENKYSQNKNGSAQLSLFKITIDDNSRKLYEALLYEPLKAMIEAVNNPDYIYLINEFDNFIDRAEIYDFWCRTMVCEVEDFNVEQSKKELVSKRLKKTRDANIDVISPSVIKKFQENASQFIQYDLSNKNMTHSEKIEHVLRSFGTIVRVAHIFKGYSSNTYLLEASAGVKISSIHSHKLDLANALDVSSVRLSKDLVVHDGKSYLSLDFVKKREDDLIFDESALVDRKIPIGKDNFGNVIYWDLDNPSTPHVLICGATGSGKSVEMQCILEYAKLAKIRNVHIFDPKREFVHHNDNRNVFVYCEIEEIEEQMANLVNDMEERIETKNYTKTLVIFDEFADAVANSRKGNKLDIKELVQVGNYAPKNGIPGEPKMALKTVGTLKSLEENLRILLQKGRSLGYNIVAGTQRASVKVITGDAKVNFPVQICFRVPKETDSRVVIDEVGAESLAGKGDGLIKSPEYNETIRFQSYYYNQVVSKAPTLLTT